LLGVVGPPFAVVLDVRAVRGVGALIKAFLGVSITCLLRDPNVKDDGVDFGACIEGLTLRPDVTKGCLKAVCGFMRCSGSQARHLLTKSTNSSSLQRSTCVRVLLPGFRLRPLELTTVRGAPFVSTTDWHSEDYIRRTNAHTEEQLFSGTSINEFLFRRSKHFHDARQLFLFVLSWKNRESRV
jgi:hypothetical protein